MTIFGNNIQVPLNKLNCNPLSTNPCTENKKKVLRQDKSILEILVLNAKQPL